MSGYVHFRAQNALTVFRQSPWRVRSLLYLLAAAVLVPMTLLVAFQIQQQYAQGQRNAEAEALRLAELAADNASVFIKDARAVMRTLAQRPQMVAKASETSTVCDLFTANMQRSASDRVSHH